MNFDLEIGKRKRNGGFENSLYLNEKDRCLGNLVLGPTGSGRTALLLNQVLHDIKTMKKQEELNMKINATTLIQPYGDASDRVLKSAENWGFKHVSYINPEELNSVKVNPLLGDFKELRDALVNMFEDHFKEHPVFNAQYHVDSFKHLLGNIILISKYNDIQEPGLDFIKVCLQDAQNLAYLTMHAVRLINAEENKLHLTIKEKITLTSQLSSWLNSIIDITIQNNEVCYQFNEEDAFIEFKNILLDLVDNPSIKNIFTTKREVQVFDFYNHIQNGGLLLINTDEVHLGKLCSAMIGKYFLSRLVNTSLRIQKTDDKQFHHLVLNEAENYYYNEFMCYLVQTRRFYTSVTMGLQTLKQIANKHSRGKVQLLLGSLRNLFIFGGVDSVDLLNIPCIDSEVEGKGDIIFQDALDCTVILPRVPELQQIRILIDEVHRI